MKKYFYLVVALCMGFAMTACDDDDNVPATEATLSFSGSYWTALIDNPQNNGPLLYPQGDDAELYSWTDRKTGLSSEFTDLWEDKQFWGGGIAISNYIDTDLEEHCNADYQLSVPMTGSGVFAVVYCPASMSFPADKSYIIKSIKIGPTTYELGSIKYAKNGCKALNEEGDYLTLVITADNDNKVEVDLARDGNLLEDWTEVDLTELGFVNELSFSIKGSDTSYGWLNSPSYFAFDDVVVDLVSKPEVEELKEK